MDLVSISLLAIEDGAKGKAIGVVGSVKRIGTVFKIPFSTINS